MICKTFEIRDRGTFIPILAIKMEPGCERDRVLFERAGYSSFPKTQAEYILVIQIDGGRGAASSDPYSWEYGRTMTIAHQAIIDGFDAFKPGEVIDVEYILGETQEKKVAENQCK